MDSGLKQNLSSPIFLTGPAEKEQEAEQALGRKEMMISYTMALCLREGSEATIYLSYIQNMGS